MWIRNILLGVAVSLSFLLGYTTVANAWPGVANRAEFQGYFRGQFDSSGFDVWHNGIPSTVASGPNATATNTFIGFMNAKLNDNQANSAERLRNRIGAVFIIKTMLGIPGNTSAAITPAQWADWRARVLYANSRDAIRWSVVIPYTVNSYYQGNPPLDDAFFYDSGASPTIVFTSGPNASGSIIYAIRRECANPVGTLQALPPPPPPANYDLDPNIGVSLNGVPTTSLPIPIGSIRYWVFRD